MTSLLSVPDGKRSADAAVDVSTLDFIRLGFDPQKFHVEESDFNIKSQKQLNEEKVKRIVGSILRDEIKEYAEILKRKIALAKSSSHGPSVSIDEQKNENNEKKLFIETLVQAATGNRQAFFKLALAYLKGIGTTQNKEFAISLFRRAAEETDPLAQHFYSACIQAKMIANVHYELPDLSYLAGRILSKWIDKEPVRPEGMNQEAFDLSRLAAKEGIAAAHRNLGEYFFQDHYGNKSLDQAISHFTKAAEKGDSIAKRFLKLIELSGTPL